MKINLAPILIFVFLIYSCNFNNKGCSAKSSIENHIIYIYKAENGETFNVKFVNTAEKSIIKIDKAGQKITLPRVKSSTENTVYADNEYTWTDEDESAILKTKDTTLHLILINPLTYRYSNEDEHITITYSTKENKRFVTIEQEENAITLEQNTAWAKGAEYGNDEIKWIAEGKQGTLIKDNVKKVFTRE